MVALWDLTFSVLCCVLQQWFPPYPDPKRLAEINPALQWLHRPRFTSFSSKRSANVLHRQSEYGRLLHSLALACLFSSLLMLSLLYCCVCVEMSIILQQQPDL